MTNNVFVLGSTIADAISQASAGITASDYISNLRMTACQGNGQDAGSSIMIGFTKNNGHFAGFRGENKVSLSGSFGLTAAALTTNLAVTSVNHTVVDIALSTVGSDATGSVVFFGAMLQKNYTNDA